MSREKKINDRASLVGTSGAHGRYQCVYSGEYVDGFDNPSFDACTVHNSPAMSITVKVEPPPDIVVFTSSNCKTIRVRANTPGGHRWDVRVLRNNSKTSVVKKNLADNSTHNLDITGLQNNGGANYKVRVRDRVTGRATTTKNPKYIEACPPKIMKFTVNCQDGITLTVDTDSGGGRWDARIFVDGDSTWSGASNSDWNLQSANNNLGRIPASGTAPDRATIPKSIESWNDVVGHKFKVRVFDRKNGTNSFTPERSVGACVQMECSSSTLTYNPSNPEPGQEFSMRFRLGFRSQNASGLGREVARRVNYNVGYGNTGPSSGFTPGSQNKNRPATNLSTDFTNITYPNPGTTYGEINANLKGRGLNCSFGIDGNGDPPCQPSDDCDFPPPTFLSKPIVQAFRGDVIAGAPIFDIGTNTCVAPESSEISAFNAGTGDDYKGSSGQLGVLATDQISGFVSASLRAIAGSDHAKKPTGLTFSNDGVSGEFTSLPGECNNPLDGFDRIPGSVTHTSSQTVTGTAVSSDKVVYIEGDLRITGDITYDLSSATSVNDIPLIRYIVAGNIYIDPSVEELHGSYVALPNNGSGGVVYTCAPNNASPTEAELHTDCVNAAQLKVYGSVTAKAVRLHRLRDTMSNANPMHDYDNSIAGEVFVDSPLNWLAGASVDTGSSSGDTGSSSIVTLASSNDSSNRTKHITLGEYGSYRDETTGWGACPGDDGRWRGYDSEYIGSPHAIPSRPHSNFVGSPFGGSKSNGNDYDDGGSDCRNSGPGGDYQYSPYDDGGDGAWLNPDAISGWAQGTGSHPEITDDEPKEGTTIHVGKCADGSTSLRSLWGADWTDDTHEDALWAAAGKELPDDVGGLFAEYHLYGQGTTLVRNTFNLTAADIDTINDANNDLELIILADDFYKVYINGQEVAVSTYTAEKQTVGLTDDAKEALVAGQNIISIQAVDKPVWIGSDRDPSAVMGMGVCYQLQLNRQEAPVDPPDRNVPAQWESILGLPPVL